MTPVPVSALAVLAALGAIAGFLALRLPLLSLLSGFYAETDRGLRVMARRGVSDHWKEKVLLVCARRTLGSVARLVLCIAILGVVVIGGSAAAEGMVPGAWPALLTVSGAVALTLGSLVPLSIAGVRRRV
ncbi:hypothetical protein HKCCE3408_07980 [Rhodobacterales bacterium HKCCE3408]|nr:hypothetical protein [Rhodobacterales bacterium HKCCE3408]